MKHNEISNSYTNIYSIVSQYDFLMTPMANAGVTAVRFGIPGTLVGISLGLVDEYLIRSNYTKSYFLSPILQGVSSFSILTSSRILQGIGGMLGIAAFRIMINEYVGTTSKIVYPFQLSLQAGYVFGIKSMIPGLILGCIEEGLINYNLTNQYYLLDTLQFVSFAHLVKLKISSYKVGIINKPYIMESVAVAVSAFKFALSNRDEETKTSILNFQQEIKEVYTKLDKDMEYASVLEKQVLVTSSLAIVEQFLYLKLIDSIQINGAQFYGKLTDSKVWFGFLNSTYNMLKIIPILIFVKEALINPFNAYFNFKFQNILYDAISEKWMQDMNPLKILQTEDAEVLVDNLNKDITLIANQGESLRKSFLNEVVKSTYSQYVMYSFNTQDLIVIYQLYYNFTQYILNKIHGWELSYTNSIRILETKKNSIMKHDARNAKTIIEREGFAYSKKLLKEINSEIRSLEVKKIMVTYFLDTWKEVEKYTNIMFTFSSIGYKSYIGELDLNNRLRVVAATESVSSFMNWKGKMSGIMKEVKNALQNISHFINIIEQSQNLEEKNLILINNKEDELVLENINLYVVDKKLLYIREIKLEMGKYYAFTGDSGSGKSSLFSKIKGIPSTVIKASGVIKYPLSLSSKKEIVYMSQSDFFPLDTTLLEAIYYPQFISAEKHEVLYKKIFQMLQSLNLCSDKNEEDEKCDIRDFLNSKKEWGSVLSGGQKKKVLLISTLLQKPKILLLDEPFTGLHQEAIYDVQAFIKEYISDDILVICIDHHASSSKDFYDYELKVENKILELKEFHPYFLENTELGEEINNEGLVCT